MTRRRRISPSPQHRALHVRCPTGEQARVGQGPLEASSRPQYGPRLRALAVYLPHQQLVPGARLRKRCADLFPARVSKGAHLREWSRAHKRTGRFRRRSSGPSAAWRSAA
jgi:hypothetical protein